MVDSDPVVWVLDTDISLENTPLVIFIGNCIRDLSDVFSISSLMKISITSFSAFHGCLCLGGSLSV